jgi:hypothetical protein
MGIRDGRRSACGTAGARDVVADEVGGIDVAQTRTARGVRGNGGVIAAGDTRRKAGRTPWTQPCR